MSESSPFSSYLKTNYALSDSEIYLLKEFIEKERAIEADLARKLQEMNGAVAEMETLRAAHLKTIEDHNKLLAPIRRTPDDVLSTIFVFSLETMDPPRYGSGRSHHISVVLSHVSRRWRDLALHTPLLWSRVQVSIPFFFITLSTLTSWSRKMEALDDKIRTWFHRSSRFPIYLSLNVGSTFSRLITPELQIQARSLYQSILETICLASQRIRELHCNLCIDSVSNNIVDLFKRSPAGFSDLQKIAITIYCDNEQAWIENIASGALFSAPSLRSFEVIGEWGDITAAKRGSDLPLYESVRDLVFRSEIISDAEYFSGAHALELLRTLPNLVTCDFQIGFGATIPPPPTAIKLPLLTSLTLRRISVPKGFASCLDLPCLHALHLDSYWTDDMGEEPSDQKDNGILELFLKFGHQLKCVTICPNFFPRRDFSQCLGQLSNVERLKLLDSKLRNSSYDRPARSHLAELSLPGICPKLQEFEMDCITNVAEDSTVEMALVDFIARRRPWEGDRDGEGRTLYTYADACAKPISVVKVMFTHAKQVDIWAKLETRDLDLDGLCLDLAYA